MRRLLLSSFVVSLAMGIFTLALPLYAAKELNASYTEIGMLGVAYVISDVLLSVPLGRIGDRRGRKSLIVGGFLTTALVFLAYSVVSSVALLIVLRFIQGATEAPIWVNVQSAVAERSSKERRGRAMGVYGTSWAAGLGIGPIIGGVLYSTVGARWAFIASGIIALVATAIVVTVSLQKPTTSKRKPSVSTIYPALLASVIYVGFVSLLTTLLPVYATKGLNMSDFGIGVLITIFTLGRAVLFIPFGKLSDRLGHRPVILLGVTGVALISFGISLAQGYIVLAFLIFLMAICESLVYPSVVSMISKAGEGKNLGLFMGIFNAVAMVGGAVFPGVGGPLADSFGPSAPFLVFAVVGIAFVPILGKMLKD